jgi:hypothetical protein
MVDLADKPNVEQLLDLLMDEVLLLHRLLP